MMMNNAFSGINFDNTSTLGYYLQFDFVIYAFSSSGILKLKFISDIVSPPP